MKAITRSPKVLVLSVESDITPTVMFLVDQAAAQCEVATDIDVPLRYIRGRGRGRTSGRGGVRGGGEVRGRRQQSGDQQTGGGAGRQVGVDATA